MSLAQAAVQELTNIEEFFNRSTKELTEDLSGFAPAEGMMTAAQQVAHAAQTVEWFVEGTFRPEGFDMNFEEHGRAIAQVASLDDARKWFARAIAGAKQVFGTKTDEELMTPLPKETIMGGAPRFAVVSAMTDHTAHHRGALTVYARLKGKVPPMPYM